MVSLMHADGLILLLASICLAVIGQGYHRWRRRVPIFSLAAIYFTMAIEHMGLYRPVFLPHMLVLRDLSDICMLVVLMTYFVAEKEPLHEDDEEHRRRRRRPPRVARSM